MRTIREMLETDEKVWVYLDSRETWDKFVGMAASEGFHFGELPAEKWTFGYTVTVHSNGEMGHFPLFIWCLSFAKDENFTRKVDFRNYIEGSDECSCEESHFRMQLYIK